MNPPLWPLEGEIIGKVARPWEMRGKTGTSFKVEFFFSKKFGAVQLKVPEAFFHQLPPVGEDGVYPEHKATLMISPVVRNNAKVGSDGDAFARLELDFQVVSGEFEQPRSTLDAGLTDATGGDGRRRRAAA